MKTIFTSISIANKGKRYPLSLPPRAPSRMKGAHIAAASSEAGGASSSASSYGGSVSGRFRLHKGVHLGRRRRLVAVRGGGSSEGAGAGDVQDLALPLGMSFAAVLAQVSGMYRAYFSCCLRGGDPKIQSLRPSCGLPCLAIFGWC